jgi:RNA polymerase sigma-70 factor (ECF subfamily)
MLDGEEKLVNNAVGGDSSAFGALYDHYQPMIYRFVLVKVGRREEAEDLTHQVFLSAWQNIKGYKNLGYPFSSWLYRIARNQVVDHYRSNKGEISLDDNNPELFIPSAVTSPVDVSVRLAMEKVFLAIKKLKPEYEDIIMLRFVEDLSLRDTAKAMKKTEGAVKLMQHRAIKELKNILGDSLSKI